MATNRRKEFDTLLQAILGSKNVYFQPPESVKLKYPCIVYNISKNDPEFADDEVYDLKHRYIVRLICDSVDYDGPLKDKITKILKVPMTQVYSRDGLYHCIYEKIY